MNLVRKDALLLVQEILSNKIDNISVDIIFAPSYPYIYKVAKLCQSNDNFSVSSQDCSASKYGAHTGEVSAEMLKSIGVNTTLIGHSERRAYYNEDDELLLNKLKYSIECGMNVIFCFGEELSDRKSQNHFTVVKNQLDNTVMKVDKSSWKKIQSLKSSIKALEQSVESNEVALEGVIKEAGVISPAASSVPSTAVTT